MIMKSVSARYVGERVLFDEEEVEYSEADLRR